jgi:hypothetical protein
MNYKKALMITLLGVIASLNILRAQGQSIPADTQAIPLAPGALPETTPNLPVKPLSEQNVTILKVGEYVEKVTIEEDETKYYNLTIEHELYKDEDLVIKVIPLDYESDPDIYISKVSLPFNSNHLLRLRNILAQAWTASGNAPHMEKIHALLIIATLKRETLYILG